jgi:hypothetical protein
VPLAAWPAVALVDLNAPLACFRRGRVRSHFINPRLLAYSP